MDFWAVKNVKNSKHINTEFTSKWRDIVSSNTLNHHFRLPFQTMSDVEHLSHEDFRCHFLDRLKLLIENLPWQLPVKSAEESAFASFLDFRIDPDLLELTGCEVSALSEQLKRVFGWNARTTGDGIVSFTECGDAVHAMHKVLVDVWEHHPENNVLLKWISDVLKGAEKSYKVYNMAVCLSYFYLNIAA